jgi:hypothetical protein
MVTDYFEEQIDNLWKEIKRLQKDNVELSRSNANLTELLGRYMMAHRSEKLNSNDLYEANCLAKDLELPNPDSDMSPLPDPDCQTC